MTFKEAEQKVRKSLMWKNKPQQWKHCDFSPTGEPREFLYYEAKEVDDFLAELLVVFGNLSAEAQKIVENEKVSVLGMFAYQGPPTKRWIETKGQYWEGWNDCCKKILEKFLETKQ